jgi:hypothetical protein
MLLQPNRVLFLTGWDWAKPFLNHWHAGVESLTEDSWVQARGSLPSDMGYADFVVAVHPGRKARKPITASILKSFNALEARRRRLEPCGRADPAATVPDPQLLGFH